MIALQEEADEIVAEANADWTAAAPPAGAVGDALGWAIVTAGAVAGTAIALLGTIQPSSGVLLGTQILFGCAAIWFALLEWRLARRR